MRRALFIWAALAGLAAIASIVSVLSGSASAGMGDSWHALISPHHPAHAVLMDLRLPRVANGFAVGALLAIAGALLQVLLRNPLAEPYILGLSGGAAIGAWVALSLALTAAGVAGCAALGSGLSLAFLLVIAQREFRGISQDTAPERLILCGVMLAALWGALLTLALSLSSQSRIAAMIFWLMGDLAGSSHGGIAWIMLVVVAAGGLWDAPRLNLLIRGDDVAASLGVHVGVLKLRIVLYSAIAAGASVALAGTIGFIGLVAPHLVRVLWGNDQRMLLPAAGLLGASLVVGADFLARSVMAPEQLPVGAVTAVLGAPIFLSLLLRVKK